MVQLMGNVTHDQQWFTVESVVTLCYQLVTTPSRKKGGPTAKPTATPYVDSRNSRTFKDPTDFSDFGNVRKNARTFKDLWDLWFAFGTMCWFAMDVTALPFFQDGIVAECPTHYNITTICNLGSSSSAA